jgi:nicotinate phosphoribosyltransferase
MLDTEPSGNQNPVSSIENPASITYRKPIAAYKEKEIGMPKRLEAHVFDLPVQELRRGYLSDIYFWREKITLEDHNLHPEVTMQIFQKKEAVLCGVDEAIAVLKLAAGKYTDYDTAYKLFDQLIDLKDTARRQFIGNHNVYLKTIEQKMEVSRQLDELWQSGYDQLNVIPARFDHWAVQGGDGYAAHIGGATGVSTDAQAQWWGAKASGTVPHALIAAVGGDTVKAVTLFGETYPEVALVALVDFDNDCVGTSLKCCEALGDRLWGVRLDTSESLVDKSIVPQMQNFKPIGVTPRLVEITRQTLDKNGFGHVKIIVSGGFDPDKIVEFEKRHVPVDVYGVGNYLMRGVNAFTADIVQRAGEACAKIGRKFNPNDRLEKVKF